MLNQSDNALVSTKNKTESYDAMDEKNPKLTIKPVRTHKNDEEFNYSQDNHVKINNLKGKGKVFVSTNDLIQLWILYNTYISTV